MPPPPSEEELEVMPWRSIGTDWESVVIPGYKLLFNLIRKLLYCFELTLLRETLEFIFGVCGPPYSVAFSESLIDLLTAVVEQSESIISGLSFNLIYFQIISTSNCHLIATSGLRQVIFFEIFMDRGHQPVLRRR